MTYSEFEQNIQDGDIVFVRSRETFLDKLIVFFTKAAQVHVGIAFWVDIHGIKHLMFMDAQGGGRRKLVSLSYYSENDMDVLIAPYKWEDVVGPALDNLGKIQYGFLEAAYVGISELFERKLNFILPKLDFGDSEICSKYIAELAGLTHIHVSPAKLYRELRKNGIPIRIKKR